MQHVFIIMIFISSSNVDIDWPVDADLVSKAIFHIDNNIFYPMWRRRMETIYDLLMAGF